MTIFAVVIATWATYAFDRRPHIATDHYDVGGMAHSDDASLVKLVKFAFTTLRLE